MERNDMIELDTAYLGWPIRCRATILDSGLHVLLTGGCRSHIGAVSTAEPGGETVTREFPGHKDQFISRPWAMALAEHTGQRVCVVCGIHYDGITRQQIGEILAETDGLLNRLRERLPQHTD